MAYGKARHPVRGRRLILARPVTITDFSPGADPGPI
jgi:hypothetical protein